MTAQPQSRRLNLPLGLQVPPLESGDRLTQVEFERRYQSMPEVKKAELIEGVVYVASPLRFDLGDKKRAYRRNGVREYLVWRVFDQKLDWFSLQDGDYESLPLDQDGVVRSRVFPGLWLEVAALLNHDMPQVLAVLQAGLGSEAHEQFVQQLATNRKRQPNDF